MRTHKCFHGDITRISGPSCSKLMTSLVCSAKATHIFSAKNIRILCIESAKTVNEMTLNELVKLTTLWTTGPSTFRMKKSVLSGAVFTRVPKAPQSSYILFRLPT